MSLEIRDCRWPWNRLYVHANGKVKPCCYATGAVGDLLRGDDLDAIWRGREMEEVRRYILENRVHRVCAGAGCAFIQSRLAEGRDAAAQAIYRRVPAGVVDARTEAMAKLGQKDALYRIGAALSERGRTLSAALWHLRAARRGSELGAYALGRLLAESPFPGTDHLARRAFARAEADGYTPAGVQRATLLIEGRGGPKDEAGGVALLRRLAENGDAGAWHLLGLCLLGGVGGSKDEAEGRRALDIAARRGVGAAREAREAYDAWQVELLRQGEPSAAPVVTAPEVNVITYGRAVERLDAGDVSGGRRMLAGAARRGSALAAYRLGLMALEHGASWRAARWFRLAAANGYVSAQTQLAMLMLFGGLRPSRVFRPLGFERLRRAAEAGEPQAMLIYGVCLRDGTATPVDKDEARRWLEHARAAGVREAGAELARLDGAVS